MRANLEWTVCAEGEEPQTIAGTAQQRDHRGHGLQAMAVRVAAIAAAILLAAAAGGMLWQAADEGVRHLQADVTAAARLEALQRNAADPSRHEETAVTDVELLDGQALAHLVVTQTLPDGEQVVQGVTRAYAHTPHGWMPLAPAELPPAAWPDVFLDPLLASAGLDRLGDHAEVLVITGASYRAQAQLRA